MRTVLLVTATILAASLLGGLAGWVAADIAQSAEMMARFNMEELR